MRIYAPVGGIIGLSWFLLQNFHAHFILRFLRRVRRVGERGTTTNMETTIATSATITTSRPEFGAGRYSAVMSNAYDNIQRMFGVSDKAAEKFARAVATQVGALMKSERVDANIRVGKASKDNKITVSEAAKLKGATGTPELAIFHAMAWAQDAMKHGISFGRTDWKLNDELQACVNEMEME